jgi:hypothetical protein
MRKSNACSAQYGPEETAATDRVGRPSIEWAALRRHAHRSMPEFDAPADFGGQQAFGARAGIEADAGTFVNAS